MSSRLAPWSEKSDIWAYAVTVWQVYANGEVPYTLAMSDEAVRKRVLARNTLPTPLLLDDAVVKAALLHCMAIEPTARPTFAMLCKELGVGPRK
mmetsp:Transcript_29623/g.60790  ORF Transcript_29623/g.60790 Transcript_29623/m.60790 type:complete len:94 (+) Transcript_29623:56-337(+)